MQTTIKKTFDAVAESRKWREKTSAMLSTMKEGERIDFLNRRIALFPESREKQASVPVR